MLDARTGQEITPASWDQIEIPGRNNVAIVQKGGWFQYIDLTTKKLSAAKFAGAHTYSLSADYADAIVFVGQTSMLLDSTGKVLIPPFAGKLSVVSLIPRKRREIGRQKKRVTWWLRLPKGSHCMMPLRSSRDFRWRIRS